MPSSVPLRLVCSTLTLAAATACSTDPVDPGSGAGPTVAIAVGVVQDTAGRPVAGADVYVGVIPATAACTQIAGGLRSLAHARTGADGAYRIDVPGDATPSASTPGASTPGTSTSLCVATYAEVRDTTALVGEPLRLAALAPLAAIPASPSTTIGGTLRFERAGDEGPREPDDTWARLARTTVPGFAGVILEGSTWVAFVTDPSTQDAAARQYVRTVACAFGCPAGGPTITVRRADYDFAQLRRWYDRVQIVTSLDGWTRTDIDESRNRLALGYADSAALRRAERALAQVNVPRQAVVLEIVAPLSYRGQRGPLTSPTGE